MLDAALLRAQLVLVTLSLLLSAYCLSRRFAFALDPAFALGAGRVAVFAASVTNEPFNLFVAIVAGG
jgi:hypothetical protein